MGFLKKPKSNSSKSYTPGSGSLQPTGNGNVPQQDGSFDAPPIPPEPFREVDVAAPDDGGLKLPDSSELVGGVLGSEKKDQTRPEETTPIPKPTLESSSAFETKSVKEMENPFDNKSQILTDDDKPKDESDGDFELPELPEDPKDNDVLPDEVEPSQNEPAVSEKIEKKAEEKSISEEPKVVDKGPDISPPKPKETSIKGPFFVESHKFFSMLQDIKASKKLIKNSDSILRSWIDNDQALEGKTNTLLSIINDIQEQLIRIDTNLFER